MYRDIYPDNAQKDIYFFHPESDCVFVLKKGEKFPSGIDFCLCIEVSKEDYIKFLKNQIEKSNPNKN